MEPKESLVLPEVLRDRGAEGLPDTSPRMPGGCEGGAEADSSLLIAPLGQTSRGTTESSARRAQVPLTAFHRHRPSRPQNASAVGLQCRGTPVAGRCPAPPRLPLPLGRAACMGSSEPGQPCGRQRGAAMLARENAYRLMPTSSVGMRYHFDGISLLEAFYGWGKSYPVKRK